MRDFNICLFDNVRSQVSSLAKMSWETFKAKCSKPVVTSETIAEYFAADKATRTKIKDVGGFVAGALKGNKRTKEAVTSRSMLTLDLDYPKETLWDDFIRVYDVAALLYSTHSYLPEQPRFRLIIPLDRDVNPMEYQALSRHIASVIDQGAFDPSTFEPNRLMFFPSVSSDGEYVFKFTDAELLNVDSVFSLNPHLKEQAFWAKTYLEEADRLKSLGVQDPQEKPGLIGDFCRAYDIHTVISKFLPDVYKPAGHNRYTFIKGTTAAGLIVYDDAKFAYSHHGSDPAFGKLLNAFDLVRIHKFGHLDLTVSNNTTSEKLPSYKEMLNWISHDKGTVKSHGEVAVGKKDNTDWLSMLELKRDGTYVASTNNILLILDNDEDFKGIFAFNDFDKRIYLKRQPTWRALISVPAPMEDVDLSGMRHALELKYHISNAQKSDDALAIIARKNTFHPIRDYLNSLKWDGIMRLDRLLIDYFGATDCVYTRAAIRKSLCAAVARAFKPGTKFDMVLILVGPQGCYKSTFLSRLGKEWFSDTITTIQGKEAYEQLQGSWIIEIAELSALNKSEIEGIKQFISKNEDCFRPAYGRVTTVYPRSCIFFGTTNDRQFLRDTTGNRRFNPIDVDVSLARFNVAKDLTPEVVDQIWAEAKFVYDKGEPLYFNETETEQSEAKRSEHFDYDERIGVIQKYVDMPVPHNWDELFPSTKQEIFANGGDPGGTPRDKICAIEIWCDCFGFDKSTFNKKASREINDILRMLPYLEPKGFICTKAYGHQRAFVRKKG